MNQTTTDGRVRSADGTSIAFQRRGTGPALIMVDPAGGYRGFDTVRDLAALLATDFTVVAYDRRGRGDSGDTPPYAVQREVHDLAALLAHAGGTAALYGFSSGALLACRAAAAGLPVDRLVLNEPPVATHADALLSRGLRARLTELLAAGRPADAATHWLRTIGVPAEIMEQMAPTRPALDAVAHTLVYDCILVEQTPLDVARAVDVPTLVVTSTQTSPELVDGAERLAAALPEGRHRALPGQWHGVADAELAPVLRDFLTGGLPRDPQSTTGSRSSSWVAGDG